MGHFRYVAKDAAGKSIKGKVEAPDERSLVNLLRSKNLLIISVSEFKPSESKIPFFGKRRPPLSELVMFSRQLATMIDAGIPVVQSMEILTEQTENVSFKKVLSGVKQSITSGSSLSQALAKQGVFSDLFINMTKAGEEAGSLDEIMDRLAVYMEKTAKLVGKVRSAMMYPSIVISMAIGITLLLLIKVIPVFKDMYEDFDAKLPTPTLALISLSEFLQKYILYVIIALTAVVIALGQYAKTKNGGRRIDAIKLKLPIFGPMLRKMAVAKFTRTLATLIKSGVPILHALEITAHTAGNRIVEEAVLRVRTSIREGENISEPLRASGVFPPMVVRMVAVGERTGELEKMLNKIADFYEDQVETMVSGLTSIIEPLIIAFLGVVIGGIAICMFLPIFSLANIVSA